MVKSDLGDKVGVPSAQAVTVPVLDVHGTDPAALGFAHGRMFGKNIAANLTTYLDRFAAGGLGRDAAMHEASTWLAMIRSIAPDYALEMDGIARGAEQPVAAIALLNARYEITYSVFGTEAKSAGGEPEEVDGCTAFGLLPEATSDGGTLIGQNWDWLEGLRGNTFVMRVTRENKPDFIGFTEAGIAGCKVGINEHGIGLCVNGLVTTEDGRHGRHRPLHVRCRDILDSERFDMAIKAVVSGRRTCSTSFMLGHANGEVINIEALPTRCGYLWPEDGIVTHANHLEAILDGSSIFEQIAPHTLYRSARLRRLLKRANGAITLSTLEDVLSDDFGHPAAICRYPDPLLPAAKRVTTVATVVLDLRARVLHASSGPLPEAPLSAYPLHNREVGS